MLPIVYSVSEKVPSVQSRKYIHTLFLAAAVAEVQLAFWQARHLANFWLHGVINITYPQAQSGAGFQSTVCPTTDGSVCLGNEHSVMSRD